MSDLTLYMQMLTYMPFTENSQKQLFHKKNYEVHLKSYTAVQTSCYHYEVF